MGLGVAHVTNDLIKRIKLRKGNKRHDSVSTFIVAHQQCTSQLTLSLLIRRRKIIRKLIRRQVSHSKVKEPVSVSAMKKYTLKISQKQSKYCYLSSPKQRQVEEMCK